MYSQIDSNKRKTYLLIFIFIAVITGIGWFLNYFQGFGYQSIIIALLISVVMTLISYYHGDKVALRSVSAKQIKKEENPYVYRLIENLCLTAGLPTPRVYIIESPALNAFATGRDPKHSSIALTTGVISAMENEELEGVIAHELSHIKNLDIRVMTIVVVLVGIIAIISDLFMRTHLFSGRRRGGGSGGGILMIAGILLILLSPIISELIKLAISRKREFLADASGSLLTRYPEGLAKALEKISASHETLRGASAATAHLFISNPLQGKTFSHFFSTHPPAAERIKRLREMA